MSNLTICNNCAGSIVLSLNEHTTVKGLNFCCQECADAFHDPNNPEPTPIGLAHDLGMDDYD